MSKYFEVLQRAARDEELIPLTCPPAPRVNGRNPGPPIEPLAREEMTKLVQRVFLLPRDGGAPRVVLFCGVKEGDSSYWICAHAARSLAAQGTGTVCVVDANLRSPSMHQHFAVENLRGLSDALRNSDPIRTCVRQLSKNNLWLMPCGSPVPDLQNFLTADRLRPRMKELRAEFDYVLVDAPPANLYTDAIVLGQSADGAVLVVQANSTRREVARKVKESLQAASINLLGAVLDKRTFPIPEALYRRL